MEGDWGGGQGRAYRGHLELCFIYSSLVNMKNTLFTSLLNRKEVILTVTQCCFLACAVFLKRIFCAGILSGDLCKMCFKCFRIEVVYLRRRCVGSWLSVVVFVNLIDLCLSLHPGSASSYLECFPCFFSSLQDQYNFCIHVTI